MKMPNRFTSLSATLPQKRITPILISAGEGTDPCYKCQMMFCFCKDSIQKHNEKNLKKKQFFVWEKITDEELLDKLHCNEYLQDSP